MNHTELRIPVIPQGVTLTQAAQLYAAAGWYVGPLRGKHPGSLLGKGWHTKTVRTGPDVQALFEQFEQQSTGVFLHVGRSGAVVFDLDHPEAVPPALALAILTAAPPRQQTRQASDRGHLLFRQPAGRTIGNGTGALGKGWGEVRGLNGVIVVAPSAHVEEADGGRYAWVGTGVVPLLPDQLAALLPDGAPGADAASDATVAAMMGLWAASTAPWALNAAVETWNRAMGDADSRHNAAVTTACMIARDARAGLYPLRSGLGRLAELFVEALSLSIGGGRIVADARARAEFAGIAAWAVAQALGESEPAILERRSRAAAAAETYRATAAAQQPVLTPLQLAEPIPPGQGLRVDAVPPAAPPAPNPPAEARLPGWFWDARPELSMIRDAARARRVGPDAALGAVLVRSAAVVPPWLKVDVGRGPSNLHIFLALIGPSGAGKSLGAKVAADLLPTPVSLRSDEERGLTSEQGFAGKEPFRDGVPLGSGEGMAEQFMGTVGREVVDEAGKTRIVKERRVVRHNVLFTADEGQSMLSLMQRAGATLGTTVRSAWSGEALGQANASSETRRLVPGGSYSVGLVAGFQPAVVAPLFGTSEAGGGTTQRFVFLPVDDPGAPASRASLPAWPGPLQAAGALLHALHAPDNPIAPPVASAGGTAPLSRMADLGSVGGPGAPVLIAVDPGVVELLDDEAYRALAGLSGGLQEDELDKHANLQRLRIAAHLGLLAGRTSVTPDDWTLACEVWAASQRVRTWLVAQVAGEAAAIATARREERVRTAELSAVASEEALLARGAQRDAQRVVAQAVRVARKVHEAGGMPRGKVRALLGSAALRDLLPAIVEEAVSRGWLVEAETDAGHRVEPGSVPPPEG